MSLTQQGSEGAFAELVRRHSQGMMKMALRILRDTQEAEDELQNAWCKAWRHIDGFAGDARFSTWMTRIVINQSLMRLRRANRARFVYLDAAGAGGAFELRDWQRDSGGMSVPARNQRTGPPGDRRIPPALRQALVLREVQELPMPEVAEQLGISLSAAKSRLLRARHELRRRLEKCCGDGAEALIA